MTHSFSPAHPLPAPNYRCEGCGAPGQTDHRCAYCGRTLRYTAELQQDGGSGESEIVWDRAIPAGLAWVEHRLSVVDEIVRAGHRWFRAARERADTIFCGWNVASILHSLPTYRQAGRLLCNRWLVEVREDLDPDHLFVGKIGTAFVQVKLIDSSRGHQRGKEFTPATAGQ